MRAEEPLSPDSRNIPSVFAGINEYYAVQATLTGVDQPPPPASDPATAARAVVQIRRCDAFGCETPAGSGVIIHPSGLILTAYHVLLTDAEDPNAARYPDFVIAMTENPRTAPQPRYRARLVASKADQDLALLAIDRTLETAALDGNALSLPALPPADVTTLFADDLHVLGYPVNGGEAISYVRVGFRSFDDGGRLIVVDQALDPGNSGGPALVLREGRLAIAGLVIRRRSTQGQLSQQGLVRAIDQLDTLTWTPRVPRAWGENVQATDATVSLQLALTLNTVDLIGQPLRLLFYATEATTDQPWRPDGADAPLVVWADVEPQGVIERRALTLTMPLESLGIAPDHLRFRVLLWDAKVGNPLWAYTAGVQAPPVAIVLASAPTHTPQPTVIPTAQPTRTPRPTATSTATPAPTYTSTNTPRPTATDTPLSTATWTPTPTPNAQFYFDRGVAYRNQEQYEPAIADYTKAIELDPAYAAAYNNRGLAYYDQKQYEPAIADYSKAIELDPAFAAAYNNRGNAYADQEQYEQAIADYTKAIELNHDPLSWPYNNRGLAYYNQEQYEQAIADYTKAIELDPAYALAYNNRGLAYRSQGQYEQAIADYTRSIELNNPELHLPYNNRGLAYYAQKQYEPAIADYTKAIELDPAYAATYYNRGLAYDRQGDTEKALADYRKALDLGGLSDASRQYAEKRLQELE